MIGSGKPAFLQAFNIFAIPRPQTSMYPALKNSSAIFLFTGRDGCFCGHGQNISFHNILEQQIMIGDSESSDFKICCCKVF
jgi:hypothetical protein